MTCENMKAFSTLANKFRETIAMKPSTDRYSHAGFRRRQYEEKVSGRADVVERAANRLLQKETDKECVSRIKGMISSLEKKREAPY